MDPELLASIGSRHVHKIITRQGGCLLGMSVYNGVQVQLWENQMLKIGTTYIFILQFIYNNR